MFANHIYMIHEHKLGSLIIGVCHINQQPGQQLFKLFGSRTRQMSPSCVRYTIELHLITDK